MEIREGITMPITIGRVIAFMEKAVESGKVKPKDVIDWMDISCFKGLEGDRRELVIQKGKLGLKIYDHYESEIPNWMKSKRMRGGYAPDHKAMKEEAKESKKKRSRKKKKKKVLRKVGKPLKVVGPYREGSPRKKRMRLPKKIMLREEG